jgi:hypothetical protein
MVYSKRVKVILFVTLNVLVGLQFGLIACEDTSDNTALSTASDAYMSALQYAGVHAPGLAPDEAADQARLVQIEDDETPFLRHRINGCPVWKVSVTGIDISDPATAEKRTQTLRDFDMYLDAADNSFLKAVCDYRPLSSDEVGELPPDQAEESMRSSGEVYLGIPATIPKTNLREALGACKGRVLFAKQIEAVLVVDSTSGRAPIDLWIITVRGIPPITTHGPPTCWEPPLYQLNHLRCAVSAESGRLLWDTTVPQYKLKDEDNPFLNLRPANRNNRIE